jgi:plastocyanin
MHPSKHAISLIAVAGLAAVAVAGCGGNDSSGKVAAAQLPAAGSAQNASQVAAVAPKTLNLVIKSDGERGRKGSDGKWHDAYLPADFSVQAGQRVTVTVRNYDDMPHSFTAPGLGVNQIIPKGAGTMKSPGHTTFTFTAPAKAGSYEWLCALPCDPWAMAHDGFMRGRVTVTA